MPGSRFSSHPDIFGPAPLSTGVAPPHRLPEGVTSLGIGYGTFILDHTPVRGFLDAEVQWTRNPSDAAVRRWSPSTAWKKLSRCEQKRTAVVSKGGQFVVSKSGRASKDGRIQRSAWPLKRGYRSEERRV